MAGCAECVSTPSYILHVECQSREHTFTTLEILTWLSAFILGINPFRIFCTGLKLGMHTNEVADDWKYGHRVHRKLCHCSEGVFSEAVANERSTNRAPFQYKYCFSWYMDPHYWDRTVMRPSYLDNGNFYTGNKAHLQWNDPWMLVFNFLHSWLSTCPQFLNMFFNPLRTKFLRENINIYLHFMSFLHTDKTQVVEIPP